MKLKDLFSKESPFNGIVDQHGHIKSAELKKIQAFLPMFEEFSECGADFDIVDSPVFTELGLTGTKTVLTQIHKLPGDFKFKKGSKIYQISRSPEVMEDGIPKGPCITPTVIDMDFNPTKSIVLTFSPETRQDLIAKTGDDQVRKMLHEQLDAVMDNPEDFKAPTVFYLLVRMYQPL